MARHPHKGDVTELVKEKRAVEVLKRRGVKWIQKPTRSLTPSAAAERRKRKVDLEVGRRTITELVGAIEKLEVSPKLNSVLRKIAIAGISELWHETKSEIARRRELVKGNDTRIDVDRQIRKGIEDAKARQVIGWIVELLISREAYQRTGGYYAREPGQLKDLAALFKVDRAAIRKAVTTEMAPKRKARKKAPRKKARKKTAKKKAAKRG